MTITLTLSDTAAAGLQYLADTRGHTDIDALCLALIIDQAGVGVRALSAQADAEWLAKKALYDAAKPSDTKATIEQAHALAVSTAAAAETVEPAEVK